MTQPFLSLLADVDRAAQVVKDKKPTNTPLSEAARSLPEHIIAITEAKKLNVQAPYFRCPAWAGLPSKAYHLHCTREGTLLPALALHRFPYYLFGKSPRCDYVLEHASISGIHAALVFHKQRECFVLMDVGSTNGVRLNGERIAKQKPIPAPVGSVIQFGYSTRKYQVRHGAPPSSKRLREEQEERSGHSRQCFPSDEDTNPKQADATPACVIPAVTLPAEDQPTEMTKEFKDTDATEAAEGFPVEPVPPLASAASVVPASMDTLHLFHLVIKHKDVENPVSRGHNKGEIITRSRDDAKQVASFILSSHARAVGGANTQGFVEWTPEAFVDAVLRYCEVSSKKKKGDLGLVAKGTFAEEFDMAAFALRRHEVSQPVETKLGIHLIYRCD